MIIGVWKHSTTLVVAFIAVVFSFIGSMSLYRTAVFAIKGIREFTKSGYEAAAANFNPDDLNADLSSKSFIVTGANSGLGYAAALHFAKRKGTVHLVCRNERAGLQAKEAIIKESGNDRVHLHILDVSKPKDIVAFAKKFSEEHSSVDVLVNNAGVLLAERKRTEDDLDMSFATNTLGYYLMTTEMLDLLAKSSDPRVIMVSSGGMYTEKMDYEDFNFDRWRKYDGTMAYARNKRQQVVMSEEFAKLHPNIFFASMHPGWADTPGVKTSLPSFYERFQTKLRTTEQGADTVVWLATAPPESSKKFGSGLFFQDRIPVNTHLPLAWTKTSEAQNKEFIHRLEDVAKKFRD